MGQQEVMMSRLKYDPKQLGGMVKSIPILDAHGREFVICRCRVMRARYRSISVSRDISSFFRGIRIGSPHDRRMSQLILQLREYILHVHCYLLQLDCLIVEVDYAEAARNVRDLFKSASLHS